MAVGGWILAALVAAGLGWMGRPVMVLLPESPDAAPLSPTPLAISRTPHLGWWLAGAAFVQVAIVAATIPAHLLPAWVIVCGVGTWLAYIDWYTHVLPTRIVAPLFAIAAVVVLLEAWMVADVRIFVRALAASALAFGSFWCFWWIADRQRPGSFGFGDVRFAAPVGLVLGSLGPWAAPVGLYLGFVVGAVLGLALKARGRQGGFAFGPAMLAGAVIGAVLST
ncbi:MAG TPA: A24 family peptidase [Aeromicrobium sp.]|nr:A24 family peptidase [Aeromicrobium sp.]